MPGCRVTFGGGDTSRWSPVEATTLLSPSFFFFFCGTSSCITPMVLGMCLVPIILSYGDYRKSGAGTMVGKVTEDDDDDRKKTIVLLVAADHHGQQRRGKKPYHPTLDGPWFSVCTRGRPGGRFCRGGTFGRHSCARVPGTREVILSPLFLLTVFVRCVRRRGRGREKTAQEDRATRLGW